MKFANGLIEHTEAFLRFVRQTLTAGHRPRAVSGSSDWPLTPGFDRGDQSKPSSCLRSALPMLVLVVIARLYFTLSNTCL